MKKEILIYVSLFISIAFFWHMEQWFDHPIIHLTNMSNGGAFGVPGIVHPFVFTFIVYALLSIPRGILKLFKKK